MSSPKRALTVADSEKIQNFILLLTVTSLGLFSCLLFFNIGTSSDVLIEEIWARALFNRGPSAWNDLLFTFSPSYFPDFFGHLLARLFFDDVIKTVFAATIFQIMALVAAVHAVFAAMGKGSKEYFSLTLLLVSLAVLFSAHYPGMWLWYYSTNDNLSATILGLFALALTIRLIARPGYKKLALLFLIASFSILNGMLFMVTFILPAIAALSAIILLNLSRNGSARGVSIYVKAAFAIALAYPVSEHLLTPLINPNSTAAGKLAGGTGFEQSLENFARLFVSLFKSDDAALIVTTAAWLLLASAIIFACLRAIRNHVLMQKAHAGVKAIPPESSEFFFILFVAFAIAANLSVPIMSGLVGTLASFRYFSTLIALPLIALFIVPRNSRINFSSRQSIRKLNIGLLVLCLAVFAFVLHDPRREYREVLQIVPSSREAFLANCLDQFADEYDLRVGVSDYWNSYPVALLSRKAIWINPICDSLEPCHVLDRTLYEQPPGTGKKGLEYNFMLLSGDPLYALNEEKIKATAPPPDRIISCADSSKIYVYQKSAALFNQALLRRRQPFLLSHKLIDKLEVGQQDWIRLGGDWGPVPSPNLDAGAPAGWSFGALRHALHPGTYRARLNLSINSSRTPDAPVVAVGFGDATIAVNPPIGDLRGQGVVMSRSERARTYETEFVVTQAAAAHPWGFWIYNFGGGSAIVNSAELQRIR
jgi:hypothetical protein